VKQEMLGPIPHTFWPEWISAEANLENIHVGTFGYNASWANLGAPSVALGIPQFADQVHTGTKDSNRV
jgi:hypothetical protein